MVILICCTALAGLLESGYLKKKFLFIPDQGISLVTAEMCNMISVQLVSTRENITTREYQSMKS